MSNSLASSRGDPALEFPNTLRQQAEHASGQAVWASKLAHALFAPTATAAMWFQLHVLAVKGRAYKQPSSGLLLDWLDIK